MDGAANVAARAEELAPICELLAVTIFVLDSAIPSQVADICTARGVRTVIEFDALASAVDGRLGYRAHPNTMAMRHTLDGPRFDQ